MEKDREKNETNNFAKKHIVFKLWPLIILACSFIVPVILCKKEVDLNNIKTLMVTDIIIVLLPLVFTIVTLALSMPNEKIYEQPFSEIRKIRKDKHFEFKEMVGLNILIFFLLTIFEIFELVIQVWALDLVSIIYCILFCYQEIPILTKNKNYIRKIIKNSGYLDEISKNNNYYDGLTSEGKIAYDILQAIVLTDGIVSTFNYYKTENNEQDIILLDIFLSLQNMFLSKCSENKNYITLASIKDYNGIEILKAVEMSFANIENCIASKKDFNYIEIVKNTESFYQITRSIFKLHTLMKALNLNEKFNSNLNELIHSAFIKLQWGKPTRDEKSFVYRILNNMVVYTVSNNEMWFVESVRDAGFDTRFIVYGIDYYYFITMYLYFVRKIEKKSTNVIKSSIDQLITDECNGLNSEKGDNICSIFNHNLHYKKTEDIAKLLPNLLMIYDSCGDQFMWFQPEKVRSWSSIDGVFDKKMIVINWFLLLLSSSGIWHFEFETFKNVFDQLNNDDKSVLITTISDYFIEEGKFVVKEDLTDYLLFYKVHTSLHTRVFVQEGINQLVSFIQDQNKIEIIDNINKYVKTSDTLDDYKDQLTNSLDEEAKKLEIYDPHLEIDLKKKYSYSFLMMSEGSEQLVDGVVSNYRNSLNSLVHDEIKKHLDIMKEINNNNASEVANEIINNKYDLW